MVLIRKGESKIRLSAHEKGDGGIAIVPVCGKADYVKTEGLKWNIYGPLDVYVMISTSNQLDSSNDSREVSISTTDDLFFITELQFI